MVVKFTGDYSASTALATPASEMGLVLRVTRVVASHLTLLQVPVHFDIPNR
jgi:hypothetical protein